MFRSLAGALLLLLSLSSAAQSSNDTIIYVHYNLLHYGDASCLSLTTKNTRLKTILSYLRPDILTVNEMTPNMSTVNSLRTNCLDFNPAIQVTTFSNTTNSDLVNMLYYNSNKLGYLGHEAITGNVRDIDVYRLYIKSATAPGDTVDLYCFVTHFKASQGLDNENARAATAADVLTWLQAHPSVHRYFLSGDLNLYSSNETAWSLLMQKFDDPAGQPTGWDGPAYALYHTQSPADNTNSCAVTGGMDNRFDFILASPDVLNGTQSLSIQQDSYHAFGNDGNSYNQALNCVVNTSIPYSVCSLLRNTSDHLPVTMRLLAGGANPSSPVREPARAPANFTVAGNPVRGQLLTVLSKESLEHDWAWQIHNSAGQMVQSGVAKSAGNQHFSIDIGRLPAGIYTLELRDVLTARLETVRFLR